MTTLEQRTASGPSADELPAAGFPDIRPAPAPVAAAGASRAAAVLAALVIGVGVVGVRDAAVSAGWASGSRWLPIAVDAVNGLMPAVWMTALGGALAFIGIALMLVAVLPRRRTAVPLTASTAVYLARRDIAKIIDASARAVPGVLDARTATSRRKAVVRCVVTGDAQEVRAAVGRAVSEELDALHAPPRVLVRTRTESRS